MIMKEDVSFNTPLGIMAVHPKLIEGDAERKFRRLWDQFIEKDLIRICAADSYNGKIYDKKYYAETATHVFRTQTGFGRVLGEDKVRRDKFIQEFKNKLFLLVGGRCLCSCVDMWVYAFIDDFKEAVLEDVCRDPEKNLGDDAAIREFKKKRVTILNSTEILGKGLSWFAKEYVDT